MTTIQRNLIDNSVAAPTTPNRDHEKLSRKRRHQRAFRGVSTYLVSVLGALLLILLVFGFLLDLGVFSAWQRFRPDVHHLVTGLFASAIGVLCVTLGLERKVEFDNIDTTLEKVNESIVAQNERHEQERSELRSQLYSLSVSLKFIDSSFSGGDNAFDIFWGISLLRARARQELIDPETFVVKRSDVPKFWLQMINNTDSTWFCTDRVELGGDDSSDAFWKRRLSNRGLLIQASLAKDHGVVVRRLFIFDKDSDAERPFLKAILHKQASAKIDVGWVSLESHLQNAPLSVFEERLGTVDFTIVNDKYLVSYEMQNKSVHSLKCTSNQELVGFVRGQYNLLFSERRRLHGRSAQGSNVA